MENVMNSQLESALHKLLEIEPKLRFIKRINRIFQYSDEPKFYQYSAETYISEQETDGHIRDRWKAGGSSMFNERYAFLKCIAEAIERYACMTYKQKDFIEGSYRKLKKKSINPLLFSKFSSSQKKSPVLNKFIFDEKTPFKWLKATSLKSKKTVLVPAQLIYLNYKIVLKKEKLIDIPISTGAAFGNGPEDAMIRGFLELIERDSFSIMYMNKLACPKVDLTIINDPRIKHLLDQMKRYRLEANIMDTTTDIGIPSFAAVVINRTNRGPAVQVGIKSHFDPLQAIVGAFQESLHTRCWMRYLYENNREGHVVKDINDIDSFEKRGMYWYEKSAIRKINFWINQKPTPLRHPVPEKLSNSTMVNKITRILKKFNYEAYYVNLTPSQLNSTEYRVIKVISPDLQPHFFNEKYKLLGGKRLSEVPEILGYKKAKNYNKIPHPFL